MSKHHINSISNAKYQSIVFKVESTMIKCCIFDMDGLLLDTERIYTEVTQSILQRYNREFTWSLKAKMMGLPQMEAAQLLINALQLTDLMTPEAYLEERNRLQKEKFSSAQLMPGVARLIEHLHRCGIPMAVATSSHTEAFQLKTMHHQHIFSKFNAIVTGNDDAVKRGKPHPDIFQEAARRLGCQDARACLVFEDALAGVEAALRANMHVCWVPDVELLSILSAEDRQWVDRVHQQLTSLSDFQPEHWGLAAFLDDTSKME